MKRMLKSTLGVVAAAAVVGATVIPAAVTAWGDNSTGNLRAETNYGRKTYTIDQINDGALDNIGVVFNSIEDHEIAAKMAAQGAYATLTDERYFVSALPWDENLTYDGSVLWNTGETKVVEGQEYIIRLYIHNNSKDQAAFDVNASFQLPKVVGTTAKVEGYINAPDAAITRYWDYVTFTSDRNFYLDYVEGSAMLYNNVFKTGKAVDESKLLAQSAEDTYNGALVGYDDLDGFIPGCYQYSGVIVIRVKPVFEDSSIEKSVRLEGEKEWKNYVDAKVGDKVEYQIKYNNLTAEETNNVMLVDSLPTNMKYVAGSTKLKNAATNGEWYTNNDDTLTDVNVGINIGGPYAIMTKAQVNDGYTSAIVRFTAEVVDKSLVCGNNRLINWAKVSAAGYAMQDNADVYVKKDCKTPENPENPTTPSELPSTGPAAVVTGVLGAGAVATAAGYYIASRKQLRK